MSYTERYIYIKKIVNYLYSSKNYILPCKIKTILYFDGDKNINDQTILIPTQTKTSVMAYSIWHILKNYDIPNLINVQHLHVCWLLLIAWVEQINFYNKDNIKTGKCS